MGGFRWGLGWFPSLVFFFFLILHSLLSVRSLWLCLTWVLLLGLFDLMWVLLLGIVGGCGFVLVGVVVAMVVGGYCCGSGGCAIVVVGVGNEREEIIYYFNV